MSRPVKKGLEYFPFDTDAFDDPKLIDLQLKYGPLGESVWMRLLCMVYREGYYFSFGDLDRLCIILTRSIGSRWTRDIRTVRQVVLYLAKINLVSSELMQRGVITSAGIQRRYLKACARRHSAKKVSGEYWLLDDAESASCAASEAGDANSSEAAKKSGSVSAWSNAPSEGVIVYNNPSYCSNNPSYCNNNALKEKKNKYIYLSSSYAGARDGAHAQNTERKKKAKRTRGAHAVRADIAVLRIFREAFPDTYEVIFPHEERLIHENVMKALKHGVPMSVYRAIPFHIRHSRFLRGETSENGYPAPLGWITREDIVKRVLNGEFRDAQRKRPSRPEDDDLATMIACHQSGVTQSYYDSDFYNDPKFLEDIKRMRTSQKGEPHT